MKRTFLWFWLSGYETYDRSSIFTRYQLIYLSVFQNYVTFPAYLHDKSVAITKFSTDVALCTLFIFIAYVTTRLGPVLHKHDKHGCKNNYEIEYSWRLQSIQDKSFFKLTHPNQIIIWERVDRTRIWYLVSSFLLINKMEQLTIAATIIMIHSDAAIDVLTYSTGVF